MTFTRARWFWLMSAIVIASSFTAVTGMTGGWFWAVNAGLAALLFTAFGVWVRDLKKQAARDLLCAESSDDIGGSGWRR